MGKNINTFFHNKGRLIFWLLVLLAFFILAFKFADLHQLYLNIKQSELSFIFLAILAQFFYFVLFTVTYKISFRIVNIKYSFRRLFPLTFAYIFVNVVAPTLGASGPALFATEASRRKESSVRTLAGVLVANLAQFITFTGILFLGAFYLYIRGGLKDYQIAASLLLIIITALLMSLIPLAIKKPKSLKKYLYWQTKIFNKLLKIFYRKKRFQDDWIEDGVNEFSDASKSVTRQSSEIKKLIFYYFLVHGMNIFSLFLIFMAFHQHILFRALISGFVMGVLFQIVGITPYGIGLTESAMALTFTSLGVATESAILITLTYRGITFWLPFLIGFILLRKIHIFGLKDISIVKLFLGNKHVINLKKAIEVRLINIEK